MNTDQKRATLRAKPPRVPKRVNIRVSGFVWSLIGAAIAGGFLNTVGIVILAITLGSSQS